jgi:signal transduction histidine kinase
MTEEKSLKSAGVRSSSDQLRKGLPIFFRQLMDILKHEQVAVQDAEATAEAVFVHPGTHLDEEKMVASAGLHGLELFRLGYTLSHVVHAYGSMCQSITELASEKHLHITAREFHDMNRCLDSAIAGAVTGYQTQRNTEDQNREIQHLGFLAHELRNALTSVNVSLQLIRKGTVGFSGNTGQVLDKGLRRIEHLIDRSLTEVRLRMDPEVHLETWHLVQMVDQILITAQVEARARDQSIDVQIDPNIEVEADQQLIFSGLSNLIQNGIKYSGIGTKIQVRAKVAGNDVEIEVEDRCGGRLPDSSKDLFKPFTQHHENRKGMGLGLTITERAVKLNHGKIEAHNVDGTGCIFKITLPRKISKQKPAAA